MFANHQGRREDDRLTTGAGRFTDDMNRPGQARAAFLRADRAHAEIAGIDVAEALAAPGVLAVLTGADMTAAGFMRAPPLAPFRDAVGPMRAPRVPALAQDRVRYVGEPVALVVAETHAQAQDAAELIAVDYADLPVVADPDAALAPDAPRIHDQVPGNVCFDYRYGDAAAVQAALATAAHVVRLDLTSERVVGNPMEPAAAIAEWSGEILHLWSPSQGMPGMRANLAAATGLPADCIRCHAGDVGGAFGIRGQMYPEYVALALAARVVGRPVKWLASRSETFVADYQGRGVAMTATLALDAEGRFLALHHDWRGDLGAHPAAAGGITLILTGEMAFGAYRIPAVSGRTRLVLTNRVPVSAYRGAGRPEMAYAVERIVDEAARQTGLDRIALRRLNAIPAAAFPYPVTTAPAPVSYDSADFAALISRGLALADWAGFPARRAAAEARGMVRGIGCALFIEPAGGVAPADQVAITFGADGNATLHEVAVSSGQGHETVFPQIVARVWGIDPARIALNAADPEGPAQLGGGAFGSRTLISQGAALDAAARIVLGRARALAAVELGCDFADFADGRFRAPGSNRSVGLDEIARRRPGALDTVLTRPSPRSFPSGMHVAEVEIDPETGQTRLVAYTSVDDCGTVIDETLVEAQIVGGLAQGLGQVFGEVARYDAEGQLLSGSFMDYPMPRADLLPPVALDLSGVPSPGNALGAKGVGEAGTVGALPAAMNAVMDALACRGVTRFDLPATPHRVWQALRDAAG